METMWYVYIVRCSDGSLYTGITTDIDRRISEHNSGKGARYTQWKSPVVLAYHENSANRSEALKREAEIKSWPRSRKLLLIKRSRVEKKENR
jgi:Predicted endonuclease containing a URI domain